MICPKCKQQIPDDSIFCEQCGTKIKISVAKPWWKRSWVIVAGIAIVAACVLIIILNQEKQNSTITITDTTNTNKKEDVSSPDTIVQSKPKQETPPQPTPNTPTPKKEKVMDGAVVFFIQNPNIMSEEELANPTPTSWIYYEDDTWKVTKEHEKTIEVIARQLKNLPEEYICHVVGISNYRGSEAYLMKKSEKRAQTVADFMIKKHGISQNRIIVDFKGKTINYGLF